MPSPRPAPKPAPPAAPSPAPAAAAAAAPSGAPDPFRLLPEVPEGISLCFTFGHAGSTITAEAYATGAKASLELAGSGPVALLIDKDPAEAFALAAAVALYNAKGAITSMAAASTPPVPAPEVACPPTPAAPSAEPVGNAAPILQQIAALPSEWQDYLAQMFAAQYGVQLPGDETMAITQEQIDFLASLLPQ